MATEMWLALEKFVGEADGLTFANRCGIVLNIAFGGVIAFLLLPVFFQ